MVAPYWSQVSGRILVCGVLLASGCADPYRRMPDPHTHQTIFSPLALPTPNRIRTASGVPGPEYWQQRADYRIDATLDAEKRRVSARAKLTYTNNSPDSLDCLWLCLEQNVFRPGSAGAAANPGLGLAGVGDFNDFTQDSACGYEIQSVVVAGSPAKLEINDTIARLPLPTPLAPRGGQVEVVFEWAFVVPAEGAMRMGLDETSRGTIFEIAQWFPVVCNYDDVHGWNTLPYLGLGEFYTHFGSYEVSITVPRDHIVAATGVLQNPAEVLTEEQRRRLDTARTSKSTVVIRSAAEVGSAESRPTGTGPLTWMFVAHDVRTFAWASSPAFIWDAAGIAQRGRVPAESAGGAGIPAGTLVQSFYPAEGLPEWAESTAMLRFSIEHYNQRWFEYPYPVASNVNGVAGGMEYPMIIFCGRHDPEDDVPAWARVLFGVAPSDPRYDLFGVTTHEIGHNWFPMVVNTDERRHAWMDEGFNTFINHYAMKEYFPGSRREEQDKQTTLRMLQSLVHLPIMVRADENTGITLGLNQYAKTSLGLIALRDGVLGAERFDRAMRRYLQAWAFKSPQPADFFRCMEQESGEDLTWFWRGWFMELGLLDQAIAAVSQEDWGRGAVRITFANHGKMVMPVVFEVRYADGSHERRRLPVEAWHSTDRKTLRFDSAGRRVVEIQIDPDGVFPDTNVHNNRWRALW